MHEDSQTNESAIEMRLKQVTRYVTLGLLGVLALCALLFMYIGSVKQSEAEARQTSQAQADLTKDSSYCSVYPNEEICVLSRKIAANPDEVLIPKDGIDGEKGDKGAQGERGRGITSFDISKEGDLMISYTDGQTQNAGKVVGANGKDGKDGKAGANGINGRGILSAGLESGHLILRYTDGTTENVGIVVGPAGANGANGVNGKDGESIQGEPGKDGQPGKDGTNGTNGTNGVDGKDGISVVDLQVDAQGYVQVTYSNGTTASAGRVIVNTITSMICETDTLTITLVDGQTFSTTVDCTPDASPIPPAAGPPAAPAEQAAKPLTIP